MFQVCFIFQMWRVCVVHKQSPDYRCEKKLSLLSSVTLSELQTQDIYCSELQEFYLGK